MKNLVFLLAFVLPLLLSAQDQHAIDSLMKKAEAEKEDSNRVFFYYALGAEWNSSNPAKSSEYMRKGYDLSVKINFPRGIAGYYIKRGRMVEGRGFYDSARVLYDSAMTIYEAAKLTTRYYSLCINVGNTYYIQGLYEKALPWYIKAADGAQKVNDPNTASQALMNIGNIQFEQKKYKEAEEYYNKAIPLAQEAENNNTLGSLWNNLGALEYEQENFTAALTYFQKGLEVRTNSVDGQEGAALCQSNLAECYFHLGEKQKALENYQLADAGFAAIPDSAAVADNLILWGNALYTWGEKTEGIAKMKQGLAIAESYNDFPVMQHGYGDLANAYKAEKDFVSAHFYLEKFDQLKDSVHAQESSELLVEMQTRFDVDQKEQENALLRQDAKLKATEDESFRRTIWGIVLLLVIGAGALIVTVVIKQRSNRLLEAKNALIEEQKKEITDSINYARRIQQAILPDEDELQKIFPQSFVLYMPKAIVSGDFWWMLSTTEYTFIAVADCTGHGVPGAFMSMLGMEMLNDISRETKDPSQILAQLNSAIKRSLRQTSGDMQTSDGMDIALCRINRAKTEMIYAGANRPLWKRNTNGALEEFAPVKAPIGGSSGDEQQYPSRTIPLSPGETIYLFTDGFADQFGGDKGKKLKTSGLRSLFESTDLTTEKQAEHLRNYFETWRGSLEQVDDVLIAGIRI